MSDKLSASSGSSAKNPPFVVQGLSNKAIAAKLSIAERTVKFHRASACEKLGVGSTAQLIARMMLLKEKGLV